MGHKAYESKLKNLGGVDDTDDVKLTSQQLCDMSGISYRQLDYWVRQGWIQPFIAAEGSGTLRLFSIRQAILVCVAGAMAKRGMSPVGSFEFAMDILKWDGASKEGA